MPARKTTEEFIEEADKEHDGKYGYSETEYNGSHTKVKIKCPVEDHGFFKQRPNNHLQGRGCPKCGNLKYTKEDFIKEANEEHNGKYNYSEVDFKNYTTKVKIKCPIEDHGYFMQRPEAHLRGNGCPTCGKLRGIKKRTKTRKQFIERANIEHNGKYGYSEVVYEGSKTKVKIKCPIEDHGYFMQTPNTHLNGSGCPTCGKLRSAKKRTNTRKQFIKRANIEHNGKYGYSEAIYEDNRTKVKIKCPVEDHGYFMQKPKAHLYGKGCPICGRIQATNKLRKSKKQFIKEANREHNGKYGYSEVVYEDNRTKVKIKCPIENHGYFMQTPGAHLRGSGCPTCGRIQTANQLTSTKEQFIKKADKIHDGKYGYSQVTYINSITKVKIKCPVEDHGFFKQRPQGHLRGEGCPECKKISISEKLKMPHEQFIKRANIEHNGKYGYSEAIYEDNKTKVKIKCPVEDHGYFMQTPDSHLRGHGCPKCGAYKSWSYNYWLQKGIKSSNFTGFKLYIVKCTSKEEFYKIGLTYTNLKNRLREVPYNNFKKIYIKSVGKKKARHLCRLERYYLKLCKKYQYTPNKEFGGMSECFSSIEPIRPMLKDKYLVEES